ncbi:putative RING-H2 finger protein ATL19 [Mercurialis annua]|uniref:putative RING-H2 finger protein ATL19 n=1 Tax=Mercurialis annua TaxID=3986 RepID=UPI0021607877|nr:putative RING-H2 finger protein ATL19 [Mercurialis annua]
MIILICMALICIILASIVALTIRIAYNCISWVIFGTHNLDLEQGYLRTSNQQRWQLNLWSDENENFDSLHHWTVEESRRKANWRRQRHSIEDLMPKVRYDDDEMEIYKSNGCVVCLNDYMENESCRILPFCKHMFHSHCIDHCRMTLKRPIIVVEDIQGANLHVAVKLKD